MKRQTRFGLLSAGVILLSLPVVCAQERPRPPDQPPMATVRAVYDQVALFPMEVGNEWTYSDGVTNYTVQVVGETVEANGLKYFEISGYWPNDSVKVRKLRRGSPDGIYEYNPGGSDFLWYQFGANAGSWHFASGAAIPCITDSGVSIGSLDAKVDVPAGKFEKVVRLDFLSPCMDGGVGNEFFALSVGLVQRGLNTISGPRTVILVAAHVGNSDWPRASYGLELSLDRPLYYNNLMPPIASPWPTARAVLIVRNETEWPIQFTFPTSQRFDFVVADALGKEMLRWSDGQAFMQVVGRETLLKESKRYSAELALKTRDGKPLPAGLYSVTGYLTTQESGSNRLSMAGSVVIEIRNLY